MAVPRLGGSREDSVCQRPLQRNGANGPRRFSWVLSHRRFEGLSEARQKSLSETCRGRLHRFCYDPCFCAFALLGREGGDFFDRDESFIKHLERIWSRNKHDASSWAAYISTVAPVEMNEVLPVQAADLLAWSVNRYFALEEQDFWRACVLNTVIALEHYRAFYQETHVLKHPGFFEWRSI